MHRRFSPASARRPRAWLRLAPLAIVALGGCARPSERLAPQSFDRPWTPATSATGEILPVPAEKGGPAALGGYVVPEKAALATLPAAPDTDPQHVYTLTELVDLAHTANPSLRVAWYGAGSAAQVPGIISASHGPRISATGAGGRVVSSGYLGKGINGEDRDFTGGTAVAAISLEWLLLDFGGARRRSPRCASRRWSPTSRSPPSTSRLPTRWRWPIMTTSPRGRVRPMPIARSSWRRRSRGALPPRCRHDDGGGANAAGDRPAASRRGPSACRGDRCPAAADYRDRPAAFHQAAHRRHRDRTLAPAMADMAEAAVAKALARRSDMLAALAIRKASEEGLLAARADFKPKIFASGTASHIRGHRDVTTLPGDGGESATLNVSTRQTSGSVRIGLRVPPFDGGLRVVRLMPALRALGHAPFEIGERVRFVDDHAYAVADAFVVQEAGPERPGFKQGLWEVVEVAAPADALLCSSSAGIPASLQQTEMRNHTRLLIAHPINPPHLIPLVEVVPTQTTDPEVTARPVAFYDGLGKVMRVIRKEVPGCVANRLQAAIFRECVALVRGGVVTIDELDDIVTTSLGVRLATSGPFLSLHLSGGDGGLPHSIEQLGPPMERLWESLGAADFDPATKELIARQADQSHGASQIAQSREAKEIAVLDALAAA